MGLQPPKGGLPTLPLELSPSTGSPSTSSIWLPFSSVVVRGGLSPPPPLPPCPGMVKPKSWDILFTSRSRQAGHTGVLGGSVTSAPPASSSVLPQKLQRLDELPVVVSDMKWSLHRAACLHPQLKTWRLYCPIYPAITKMDNEPLPMGCPETCARGATRQKRPSDNRLVRPVSRMASCSTTSWMMSSSWYRSRSPEWPVR